MWSNGSVCYAMPISGAVALRSSSMFIVSQGGTAAIKDPEQ